MKRLLVIVAIAVGLTGCAGNARQQSAASAAAAASSCVTHTGSCALSASQAAGGSCWCNFGYYVRTGFAE